MIATLLKAAGDLVYYVDPQVQQMQQTWNFVGNQVPMFLLAFGFIFMALALFGPQLKILTMPIAMLCISASLAWYLMIGTAATGGAYLAMPATAIQMVGIGVVLLVLARIFGAATLG